MMGLLATKCIIMMYYEKSLLKQTSRRKNTHASEHACVNSSQQTNRLAAGQACSSGRRVAIARAYTFTLGVGCGCPAHIIQEAASASEICNHERREKPLLCFISIVTWLCDNSWFLRSAPSLPCQHTVGSQTTPLSVVCWFVSYLFTSILLHMDFGSQGDVST